MSEFCGNISRKFLTMIFDDYLSCTSYENQPAHPVEAEFAAFYHEESERYFFALLDANGEALLRSEGYAEEKARNNGIQSVLKNRGLVERYKIVEDKGDFFVILRAGNRQEIARSCPMESMAEAEAFVTAMTAAKNLVAKGAEAAEMTEVMVGEAESPVMEPMMVEAVAIEMDEAEMPEVFGVEMPAAEVVEAAEAAAAPVYAENEPVAAYAPLDLYAGHSTLTDAYGPTGYALFDGTDGKHYFAVYNPDNTVFLRSQAFDSADSRNETFAAVQRNITQPGQYHVVETGAQFAYTLSDESGREISRSPEFDAFTDAFRNTPAGRVRVEGITLY